MFTEKMEIELSKQAVLSINNIVNQIYEKAMIKWQQQRTSTTINSNLSEML